MGQMHLFAVQPDYTCSFSGGQRAFTLNVTLDEPIPKQFINELPWNCWSSSFEYSEPLPFAFHGVTDSRHLAPFIDGAPREVFPQRTVGVYLTCIDLVKFYCGSITFQRPPAPH